MICKEYSKSINVTAPNGYFENWYADMWCRRVASHIASPDTLDKFITEELQQVGGSVEYATGRKYKVIYKDDSDYTAFVLRWAN